MSIIVEKRLLSSRSALASALVEAGVTEDREILVEERVSGETLKELARRNGESNRSRKVRGANPLAMFMAACAAMNNLQVEDVVLFLEELGREERIERRKAFMASVAKKKEALVKRAVFFVKRAEKALRTYVRQAEEDWHTIINDGVIRLLAKAAMVAKARLAEVL